ncbi:MAG: hypothetical protein DYG98_00835 [Haliscomenobacteraceae bacterium CHB4]|nr:hypothetical protein [Haliscomenobacteraceae bacterium CHB4]
MLFLVRHCKTGAVSVFILLLAFQAAGWFLVGGVLQFQAKQVAHIAMDLPETPLKIVTLHWDVIQKIRVGKKEIRLNGNLYDIKKQTVSGDSATLTLYHDRHEQAVMDALSGVFSAAPVTGSLPLHQWLAQWLGAAFLLPPAASGIPAIPGEFFSPIFHCSLRSTQHAPGCFSPPPERL